jgi:hypothetical protein
MVRRKLILAVIAFVVAATGGLGNSEVLAAESKDGTPTTKEKGCSTPVSMLLAKKPGKRDKVEYLCFDRQEDAKAYVVRTNAWTAGILFEHQDYCIGINGCRTKYLVDFDCTRGDDPAAEGIGWTNLDWWINDLTSSLVTYCVSMTLFVDPGKTGYAKPFYHWDNGDPYSAPAYGANRFVGWDMNDNASSLKFGN